MPDESGLGEHHRQEDRDQQLPPGAPEQVKGILAERHHVNPDEAFLILRRYARNHNRPLTALAGDVIHGTADISPGGQATTRPALKDEPEKSPGPEATSGPHS